MSKFFTPVREIVCHYNIIIVSRIHRWQEPYSYVVWHWSQNAVSFCAFTSEPFSRCLHKMYNIICFPAPSQIFIMKFVRIYIPKNSQNNVGLFELPPPPRKKKSRNCLTLGTAVQRNGWSGSKLFTPISSIHYYSAYTMVTVAAVDSNVFFKLESNPM